MELENQPMSENASVTAVEDAKGVSIFSIVAGVFYAPAEAFSNYVKKPNLWVPLILVMVLFFIFSGATAKYNAMLQYDLMKDSTALPQQVIQQMHDQIDQANFLKAGAIAGIIVMPLIFLLYALLAWPIGSFIFGGKSKFSIIWGVVLLGGLIVGVGNLVKLPLMIANESMYVSFGLAAFMKGSDFTSILYLFLYYMDAFAIWSIIVEGIGFSKIFNLTTGKGVTIAVVVNLLMTCALIGLQVLGMSFAGVDITFF